MKRNFRGFFTLFISIALLACMLPEAGLASEAQPVSVVTTIFPIYDWTREIVGDAGADITMLLNSGVDLHNYQPTVDDMLKITNCDVFIYVGGESDDWVEDALEQSANPEMKVINLVELMGSDIKLEEIVEGMEHDHDHDDHDEDHDEDYVEDHDHEHEDEVDEHVWLSLKNAQKLVAGICAALSEIDPANADTYAANAEAYIARLGALDAEYQAAVEASDVDTLLFGDRFPSRYMADDYGLNYYAAFTGCSAETEASFETIMFLANKVDELGLKSVLTIEGADHRIAETIIATAKSGDQAILTMDSMQSVTAKNVEEGASYIAAMEQNLEVLKEALRKY